MIFIGPTMDDVRDSMITGESGIEATQKPWNPCEYHITERRIVWPKKHVIAHIRTSEKPRSIRSLNTGWAWCDELAFWSHVEECWANLVFANRKGSPSEYYFGTTPLPTRFIRWMVSRDDVLIQGGSSYENRANLDPDWFRKNIAVYEGTRRGEQEIHGKVLDDAQGSMFDRSTFKYIDFEDLPDMQAKVVAVDPSGGEKSQQQIERESQSPDYEPDETGIIAVTMDFEGNFYVFRDVTPESGTHSRDWSQAAVVCGIGIEADEIVAEKNYGGDMVETAITGTEQWPQFEGKMVVQTSIKGKVDRAEPVSQAYMLGQVFHVGGPSRLRKLESELEDFDRNTGKSNGRSPNRLDALVHAILRLMQIRMDGGGLVQGMTEDDMDDLVRSYQAGLG
jgi:phage terminase large subunit-like protein